MNIWKEVYLGNSLENWMIAFAIMVFSFVFFEVVQRVVSLKIVRLAKKTGTKLDDLLMDILSQTKLFALLVASLYIGSLVLDLQSGVLHIWEKFVLFVMIIQVGFWAGSSINFWLNHIVRRRIQQDTASATTIAFLGFLSRFILWSVIVLFILDNLGINITSLAAGLGIGGVAIALSMQNILGDLFASLSIVLDKPFVIGDFIVVDQMMGTIEDIGLKTTRLRSIGGEQLIFANNDLLKSRIRNFKRMTERRVEFKFGVVYQTPLEKLKKVNHIIRDIVAAQKQARLDHVHFKEYGESSLNFEVAYFVTDPDSNLYMDIQEAINLEIFRRFQEEGIEFAYPTRMLFVQHETKTAGKDLI